MKELGFDFYLESELDDDELFDRYIAIVEDCDCITAGRISQHIINNYVYGKHLKELYETFILRCKRELNPLVIKHSELTPPNEFIENPKMQTIMEEQC